jgi:subtilase family serine protease
MKTRFPIWVAMFLAQGALAQNYVVQSQSMPYASIVGGTAITTWTPTDVFDPLDEGTFALPLGFSFPFYGQTFTTVNINTNGFLTLSAPCPGTCYDNSRTIPSTTAAFHNLIAPWWDDFDVMAPGQVTYKTSTGQAEIEFNNVGNLFGSATVTFKVILTASGVFQIHYGPQSGSGLSGITGFENATGSMGAALLMCGGVTCTNSNFPTNTLYTIGQPVQPDLIVEQVNLNSVQKTGNSLSLSISPTFRNFGQNAATGFLWRAFLSTDTLYDASDTLILNSTTPLSVPGGMTVSDTAMATITAPPNGNYYVIVEADYTNVVNEGPFGESNNFGATTNYFTSGVDLVATGITGPTQSGPGNLITVHVNWFNQGTDPAGNVGYRVYLSTDNVWSTNDFQLYPASGDATKMISGGQTVSEDLTFPVPQNVPGGDFFYILQLNTGTPPVAESMTNDTIASTAKVTMKQADLVIHAVDFVDVATGVPLRHAIFRSQGRVRVTASNEGGADAKNFNIGVVISQDTNLSLLQDTLIIESPVTVLAQGAMQTFDITFTIPENDRNMRPFTTGNYFWFALLDSSGVVTELNEFNNNLMVPQPVLMHSPAPDLTVVRCDAPAAAGVGEIVPVYRVFKNIGNVDAPEVKYRYFVSANEQITLDDTPIQMVSGSTMSDVGSITLMQGQADTKTELVQLPGTLTPGTYYIGAVIDSANQVAELDETNNGLGSAPVAVAPAALRISTPTLPDAVLGRPYSFQLSVSGDAPGSTTAWVASGLPMGMTLSPSGLLGGTPTAETVVGVTFTATNNGHSAVSLLALRVLPTTTQVEITTPSLPSVVNSSTLMYETYLGAAGGVKPYTWRQVPMAGEVDIRSTLGIALDSTGHLSGFPKTGLQEKAYPVTFEVRDTLGTTSVRQFNLRVVAPGAIIFTNLAIPDGLVGVAYDTDVSVKNADGSALAKPLTYRIISGALPDGVAMVVDQDVLLLEGTPTVGGQFAFTIEVEDSKGRNDAADFLLRIYPSRLPVGVNNLAETYHPGDPVDFNFVATGSSSATFRLFSGVLPPGTTVGADGHVTGTIAMADSEGTYNFVVEAKDATGASGLGAFSVLVKKEVVAKGCSAAPLSGALWLLLALLPKVVRRRRVWGVAVVAALALPVTARAQDYLLIGPTPITYAPLNQATTISSTGATVTIPFDFKFYGQSTTSIFMSQYGYLTTTSNTMYSFNSGIPSTSTFSPTSFIAPWWDSIMVSGGLMRYQNFGTAPNRYLVFEWSNVAGSSATTAMRMSFEVILYEGTNEIRFAYAASAPGMVSASVGIQKDVGIGIAGLSCTTASLGNCSTANYPAGAMLQFQQPPDLTIVSVSMDQVGFAGVAFHASALVANVGGTNVPQNSVRFYLSTDATYQAGTDPPIGDSYPLTDFPANAQTLVTSVAPIPMGTAPGTYYVFSMVDPDNSAPTESNEMNNFGPPMQITVGPPTPDLVTQNITAPMTASPGATIAVGRTFTNVGNAPAGVFKYTWFLSDNSVVSISDQVLGPANQVSDLAPMMSSTQTDMVTLPTMLPAGMYWIGACVNYDPQGTPQFGLMEISQVNNCNQAPMPIVVSSGALAIISPMALPGATQYSPYGVRLRAAGGDGQYAWQLGAGSALPAGLNFTAQGDVQGTPAVTGSFSFQVKVSSGGTDVTQQMSLMVSPGNIPLSIVDQDLPAAEFGRAYDAPLVAVGGKPPYVWHLKMGSQLPAGLALSPEGGIEGRANASGDFNFSVEVTDAAMTQAAKDLRVRVVNPSSMHIATSFLNTAYLKQDYTQQLQAVGGKPPYTWTVLKFQQLPQNATEKPGDVLEKLPDGFGIYLDDQNLDYFRGEPKMAGLYAITLKATDANSAEDYTSLLLTVSYTEPIAITTTALPDAFVNHDYAARLSHNRGTESTDVVFSLPCVQQATAADMFACAPMDATQKLPDGLTLSADGAITGTPTDPGGNTDKVFSFLVKVVDGAGRQDVRSLSIRLRPNVAQSGGGCSGTGLSPSLLAVLALGLARRRLLTRR